MVCFYGSHYVSLARTDVAGSAFEPSQCVQWLVPPFL